MTARGLYWWYYIMLIINNEVVSKHQLSALFSWVIESSFVYTIVTDSRRHCLFVDNKLLVL